jgi:hypothetical protein
MGSRIDTVRDLAAARIFHRPPSIPSTYYNGTDGVLSTLTTVANTMYLVPFEVESSKFIDRIVIECTTLAGSSSVRVGVYATLRNGLPGALVANSAGGTAADTTSTGVKSVTVTNVQLPSGRVWFAVVAQGGTPVLRSHTTLEESSVPRTDAVINANRLGYSHVGVSGALPAAPTLGSLVPIANVPGVLVRAV